ncbi:MAG: cupin domain-containing protein [Candidatus Limnocylindria bacterium]
MSPEPEPLRDGREGEGGIAAAGERLRAAGVDQRSWSNGPGDRFGAHEHASTKLLVCAEGSITFLIGSDEHRYELRAGHGFVLPAGTRHAAVVGPDGCICVEGYRD